MMTDEFKSDSEILTTPSLPPSLPFVLQATTRTFPTCPLSAPPLLHEPTPYPPPLPPSLSPSLLPSLPLLPPPGPHEDFPDLPPAAATMKHFIAYGNSRVG